ncbi:para-aminobenzoate synthase [Pluteus cervinus]|uniref:Para-aminobenzoate synthase n=1 Tax=Pluteus cervinus TaxID=181527 RepID=A0ACD3BI51_9AGAR|nr:para-aminobenzoate synthase [Pluteus cervinus]
MTFEKPRLLFIDSYDSFTHNLAALCKSAIPHCSIYIIKNDQYTIEELQPHLKHFSAVIVGPGPGSPDNPRDIGVVKDLWRVADTDLLPIFGVCLGLQSLGLQYGSRLDRLRVVKHGQASVIHHSASDIFQDVAEVIAVRYHSLHVVPEKDGPIEVLAWADDGEENGQVVMAMKHTTRPFWAVQYHPESVCTRGGGLQVLENFWRLAQAWTSKVGRKTVPMTASSRNKFTHSWPSPLPGVIPRTSSHPGESGTQVLTQMQFLPGLSITSVCELFGAGDSSSPFVLLDSAALPGRFSIIGSLSPSSLRVTYFAGDNFVRIIHEKQEIDQPLESDIWGWLASFMGGKHATSGCKESPFWGGMVGYLSYELGVHSLEVPQRTDRQPRQKRHPDVNLVFVERSIVVDSSTGKVYTQSLLPNDHDWVRQTSQDLAQLHELIDTPSDDAALRHSKTTTSPVVTLPDKARYIHRINTAKEHLFAGDSYELCLTAHTHVSTPPLLPHPESQDACSSWLRYKMLRQNNPAPHSAYFRLQPTTFLSSSPERFLSYSRSPNSVCQLRPIKGTVRKAPGITREVAERLLSGSTKEVAENLMIVDLIRHDLYGVVGEDVQVKQFCKVEEYKTVWQLVSVIEGRLPEDVEDTSPATRELGWEVLRRSLPPGSMTGAPKKRSVEILQTLEDDDRSVYSGVFGYWCVGGGGDWSVVIRSCFKHDGESSPEAQGEHLGEPIPQMEEWTIGAGGAITALSDAEAEWDEMVVKLQSVLRAFGVSLPEP